jgi:hypothetical protein
MPQLFQIADEIERFMAEAIDYETGEIDEGAAADLDALEMERDEKALAIARYQIGVLAEAEMVKKQRDRLDARAKVLTNQAGWLKGRLAAALPVGTKLHDDVVKIGWRKSQAVEVLDPDALPGDCWKEQDPKIDVEGIKGRIKDGEEIPGAKLVTRHHLSIR